MTLFRRAHAAPQLSQLEPPPALAPDEIQFALDWPDQARALFAAENLFFFPTHNTPQKMNTQIVPVLGGLVRHLLTLAAGGLITAGTVNTSQVEIVAGSVTAILVVVWSAWQKSRQAAR
jgi:hypothetical protein